MVRANLFACMLVIFCSPGYNNATALCVYAMQQPLVAAAPAVVNNPTSKLVL
jgi:hypothetical protein